ncbi:MAG: Fe-S protein assembly co-chaperone HscB [Alphaproteobacteria bacterium]|nr:Fe-S protein assembly co-chaperone HscB [Alphaproteobacteria bacterium]
MIAHGSARSGSASPCRPGYLPCWSCRGPVTPELPFCATCQAVQPPGHLDHFARLGITPGFAVDAGEIDRRYFALQRRLHPDRFATRSSRERALSQQQATSLNEAYETLKDPLARAGYLLKLRGIEVNAEGCNTLTDPVLLSEAMELREALSEADDVAAVDAIAARAAVDIGECLGELARAFACDDLAAAGRLTTRLKYLTKLADEARVHRVKRAGARQS